MPAEMLQSVHLTWHLDSVKAGGQKEPKALACQEHKGETNGRVVRGLAQGNRIRIVTLVQTDAIFVGLST